MGKKIILIVCILVVILALSLFAVYLLNGAKNEPNPVITNTAKNTVSEPINDIMPVLDLMAYPEVETDDSVEISIIAKIEGDNSIDSVKTPDGNVSSYSTTQKYIVNDNGEYEFTVTASNGNEATKTISITNIKKSTSDNPYIPEGFVQVEGTEVNSGFVIKDMNENQYVWIPAKEGKAVRSLNINENNLYLEDDRSVNSFNNSIARYHGFYIARFEASRETLNGLTVANSVEGVIPWSNVNYKNAHDAAENTAIAYGYSDVKTALINSYAWDTTLDWINSTVTNYSKSRNYGNYSGQILPTGSTESDVINNIADLAGNLREWTTERYDDNLTNNNSNDNKNNTNSTASNSKNEDYRVIRAGSAVMDKVPISRMGEKISLKDNYWGFRTILYKE